MRCSKCGATIGNSFVKVNGMLLCDNCARDLKIDEVFKRQTDIFNQAFPSLDVFPNVFSLGSDLDFSNTKIKCPKCGTTLRDVESGSQLGCIECYNTFNESILKNILKLQGSSEYMGRKPGVTADIEIATTDMNIPTDNKEVKKDAEVKPEAAAPNAKEDKDILAKLRNADLGTVPDEMLEQGMKKAAEIEDYDLAVRLRDELKSRKGDN